MGTDETRGMMSVGALSLRSSAALKPALSYWGAYTDAQADLWDANVNPDGVIPLVVAENRLSAGSLRVALASRLSLWNDAALFYGDWRGSLALRSAISKLLCGTFMQVRDTMSAARAHTTNPRVLVRSSFHCLAATQRSRRVWMCALSTSAYWPELVQC